MQLSSCSKILVLVCLAASSCEAFTPNSQLTTRSSLPHTTATSLRAAESSEDKVAALRAAAAKAREEADRLTKELGKSAPARAATAVATKPIQTKSPEEIKALARDILNESDVTIQSERWNAQKESSALQAFGNANLRTFPVSLDMLENRAGLTSSSLGIDESDVSLDDFKYATLWVTGSASVAGIASLAFLPPNIGATLCYFFALLPILFLGLGSSAPGIIAGALVKLRGAGDGGVDPRERICRHEAAHFCCGYWCGLPVQGYSIENDVAQVEFGVNSQKLSATEVAALSVTALSGLVGEARKWEKAIGAENDLMTLENVFRQSDDFIGANAQQDLTRWGALTANNLLTENAAKYEEVVTAFQQGKSVEDCIAILEAA